MSSVFILFQCAMCRAIIENNEDTKVAEFLNNGIVYLMTIPYVLFILLGVIIIKLIRSKKQI